MHAVLSRIRPRRQLRLLHRRLLYCHPLPPPLHGLHYRRPSVYCLQHRHRLLSLYPRLCRSHLRHMRPGLCRVGLLCLRYRILPHRRQLQLLRHCGQRPLCYLRLSCCLHHMHARLDRNSLRRLRPRLRHPQLHHLHHRLLPQCSRIMLSLYDGWIKLS